MKNLLLIIICFLTLQINSQNDKTINWINNNAIKIEDANPDTELLSFSDNTPIKFSNAKIFGFGEASHNGKEFFDIKAKFFKHLVKTQGVKIFIMEESYQAESAINEWISGGKGDVNTIGRSFGIQFWNCKEVVALLQWMRNYNLNKPREEQIRFYGMDVQNGKNINQEIRDFVKKHEIPINEELLMVADSCANKKVKYNESTNWATIQIPKLKKIEQIILDFQINNRSCDSQEFKLIIRALNYLINYTHLTQNFKTEVRDLKMFENVKWIIDNEAKNGKAFIWAHNEHINKKEMNYSGSGMIVLGRHLKDYYKQGYYSVGFDFGIGELEGYVTGKNKSFYVRTYQIEKPFRRTYAKTLIEANEAIYFVDMDKALNSDSTNFFAIKKKHLLVAGGGYQPRPLHRIKVSKVFTETYDGLIFIKKISPATYFYN